MALAKLSFVERCEAIHFLRPPGTGKTDLLPEHIRSKALINPPAPSPARRRSRPPKDRGADQRPVRSATPQSGEFYSHFWGIFQRH
jgi:hypothetical protein